MTKSTSGGCDQFETSPDAIEPEFRTALCERRQTDRLKTNYSIDGMNSIHIYLYPLVITTQTVSLIISETNRTVKRHIITL